MARIFITGINGFIGRNLAEHLRRSGHDVVGSARRAEGDGVVACDIKSPQEVRSVLVSHNPDIVIHAAALSSVTDGKAVDYYETNVCGSENVLHAVDAIGRRIRFVYISTAGVYGNQSVNVLGEDLCPSPVSHYGISKLAGEFLVGAEFSMRHDVTIVRPFNIVGVGQKSSFIFPKLVRHFKNREKSIKLGNLEPRRDYLSVGNCCNYIEQLIFNEDAHGETVNLCANHGTSVQQLLDSLVKITSHHIKVEVDPSFVRKNEVWSLLGSNDKLKHLCVKNVELTAIEDVLRNMLLADDFYVA